MTFDEKIPFLEGDRDEPHSVEEETSQQPSTKSEQLRLRLTLSIIANVVLLGLCISLSLILIVLTVSWSPSTAEGDNIPEPYSPANAAVEYTYVPVVVNDTRFVGQPDSTWDDSMHELLDGTLIRISDEELEHMGETSVAFKNGGYAAGLGVAHNLHCVKRIKQFLYREHFYPGMKSGPLFIKTQLHADHCLDFIRQSVMCHADFTTYTLEWGHDSNNPRHRAPSAQKCVDWNKLHAWMQSRATSSDMFVGPDEKA